MSPVPRGCGLRCGRSATSTTPGGAGPWTGSGCSPTATGSPTATARNWSPRYGSTTSGPTPSWGRVQPRATTASPTTGSAVRCSERPTPGSGMSTHPISCERRSRDAEGGASAHPGVPPPARVVIAPRLDCSRPAAATAAADENALERTEHPLFRDPVAGEILDAQYVIGEHLRPPQRRVVRASDGAAQAPLKEARRLALLAVQNGPVVSARVGDPGHPTEHQSPRGLPTEVAAVESALLTTRVEHVDQIDDPEHAPELDGVLVTVERLHLQLQLLPCGQGQAARLIALAPLGFRRADAALHPLGQRIDAGALFEHESRVVRAADTLQNGHAETVAMPARAVKPARATTLGSPSSRPESGRPGDVVTDQPEAVSAWPSLEALRPGSSFLWSRPWWASGR